jgi:hypothetical protein
MILRKEAQIASKLQQVEADLTHQLQQPVSVVKGLYLPTGL